ncbi:MAG TPA: hypothetical protein VGF82_01450 [Terracidiphilus sp.]
MKTRFRVPVGFRQIADELIDHPSSSTLEFRPIDCRNTIAHIKMKLLPVVLLVKPPLHHI